MEKWDESGLRRGERGSRVRGKRGKVKKESGMRWGECRESGVQEGEWSKIEG